MRIEVEAATERTLEVRIEKANKALRKIKQVPVVIISQEIRFKEGEKRNMFGQVVKVPYVVATLEIPDAIAKVADQEIIGRITSTPVGNLVTALGKEEIPVSFREEALRCDHCATKRNRKASWIIRKNGKLIQIGDQCSTAYFGTDVEEILKNYTLMANTMGEDEDWGGYGRRWKDMAEFQLCCSWLILTHGFISNKVAQSYPEGLKSTSELANWILFVKLEAPKEIAEQREYLNEFRTWCLTGDNLGLQEKCLEFWKERKASIGPENNFEWNVMVSMFGQSADRWVGLVTYGVKIYLEATHPSYKAVEFYRSKMAPIVNEPLGQAGDRPLFKALVLETLDREEYWLVRVQATSGHLITWFSSNRPDFQRGDSLEVKATIKDWREYKGQISTRVNRPKITVLEPQGA